MPRSSPADDSPAGRSGDPPWLDAHLDLAYLAAEGRDLDRCQTPESGACVSWPDLAEAPVSICLGTIFVDPIDPSSPAGGVDEAEKAGLRQIEWYESQERRGRIRIVRTAEDLDDRPEDADARVRVVLLMEGAEPIRDPAAAAWWFAAGVRAVGLTWARGSRYAGGNASGGGLTSAGRELVAALDELGILHDASHLSDEAFADLLDATPRRIVATHSNLRRLVRPEARHLSDEQVAAIASRDGAIGLNLYGRFLCEGRRARLDDCLGHLDAIAAIAGRHRVGLGSDLDGGFTTRDLPEGLEHPRRLRRLDEGLAAAGWSGPEREGFRIGNWRRVLRDALPTPTPARSAAPRD
jgi:membrane dipeptidase